MATEVTAPPPPSSVDAHRHSSERKPENLSGRPSKLRTQVEKIVSAPTNSQISRVAEKLGETPEEARKIFENAQRLLNKKGELRGRIGELRSQAIHAGNQDEFDRLHDQINREKAAVAKMDERIGLFGETFREAGVQLDPSQIPLSAGEKARAGMQRVGEGITGAGAKTGENISGVGKRIGEVAVGTVKGAGELAESGANLGRRGIGGLLKKGLDGLKAARSAGESGWTGVQTLAAKAKVEAVGLGEKALGGVGGLVTEAGKGAKATAEFASKPFVKGYDVTIELTLLL